MQPFKPFSPFLIRSFLIAALLCLLSATPPAALAQVTEVSLKESLVRKWFDSFRLDGLNREALFHEFHPIDGTLVARYGDSHGRMVLISFVDNKRKHPVYGLPRSARDIVSVGASAQVNSYAIGEAIWYGDDTSGPILAVDVTEDIKIIVVGWTGVTLDEVVELAADIPVLDLSAAAP